MINGNLLYSTGKSTQFIITYMGKMDLFICMTDYFAVHLKLIQHCKSTILQIKFKKKKCKKDNIVQNVTI